MRNREQRVAQSNQRIAAMLLTMNQGYKSRGRADGFAEELRTGTRILGGKRE